VEIPLDLILIQTVNGIVTGMILALVASGLTLIFGIMDVVNFAHGELFMLGAYFGVVVLAATGNFWLALLASSLLVALIGAVLQVLTLRATPSPQSWPRSGSPWSCRTTPSGSSAPWPARSRSRSAATSHCSTWNIRFIGW
jgi:Branched-chain amino acid transport system / permease component